MRALLVGVGTRGAHQYAGPSIAEHAGIACVTAVYAPVALPSPELAPPPAPGQVAGVTTSACDWTKRADVGGSPERSRVARSVARSVARRVERDERGASRGRYPSDASQRQPRSG
jgi:hypothetical protein